MPSLAELVDVLQADLLSDPPRIAAYADLPFAILCYAPTEEWELRRRVRLLTGALEHAGKRVTIISLADLLWRAVDETEGMEAIVDEERRFGFARAEGMLNRILTDDDFMPLPDLLTKELSGLDPRRDVAFLVRAGSMSPDIYHMSRLLDEMHGRTRVPTILCYPGRLEGVTGLVFMDIPGREPTGNYRVKVYG